MNLRPILAPLLLATCFSGCATFSDAELGQMRQRGVSPAVIGKMEDGHVLSPADVIELTRRRVPDDIIIRQIDDTGVDYVLSRNDFKKLQDARVSRPVMDALITGSEDFANRYNAPVYRGYAGYPYDGYYFNPAPYYYPYPAYGYGISVGINDCHYGGHGHHGR